MAQKAILHEATRIIRVLTTEVAPQIGPGFIVVDLVADINIDNGPWKLDAGLNKVRPTVQEFRDSGLDEAHNAATYTQAIVDFRASAREAITRQLAVQANTGLPAMVRQAAGAEVDFIRNLGKVLRMVFE